MIYNYFKPKRRKYSKSALSESNDWCDVTVSGFDVGPLRGRWNLVANPGTPVIELRMWWHPIEVAFFGSNLGGTAGFNACPMF